MTLDLVYGKPRTMAKFKVLEMDDRHRTATRVSGGAIPKNSKRILSRGAGFRPVLGCED